jgi:maltose O-acetyltransferase
VEPLKTGFWQRVLRVSRDEVVDLQPARLCGAALSALLPQLSFNYLRTTIWRSAGVVIGERARIMGRLELCGRGSNDLLRIGAGTFITGPLRIDLHARVTIGERVHIGQDVMLLTVDHEIGSAEERCAEVIASPIEIGDGAWLSSRCLILPGVTVGAGAIVAAGAVVTRDVPENTLVAGVPARVVRSLEDAPESERRRLRVQANAETSRSPLLRAAS